MSDRVLRPSEAAKRLGVSRSTVYRWFWENKLLGTKMGEKNSAPVRIFESSVRARERYFADKPMAEITSADARLLLLAYAQLMVARG